MYPLQACLLGILNKVFQNCIELSYGNTALLLDCLQS